MSMELPFTELPTTPEEVRAALTKVRAAIAVKRGELKVLEGLIKAVQAVCAHPHRQTHYDYGGGSDSVCSDCGDSY